MSRLQSALRGSRGRPHWGPRTGSGCPGNGVLSGKAWGSGLMILDSNHSYKANVLKLIVKTHILDCSSLIPASSLFIQRLAFFFNKHETLALYSRSE